MSYILEALKKADQERDVGAVPNLATPPQVRHPGTRSRRWLWLVVALLFVNLVLVAMLLLKDRDAEVPAVAQLPPEPSAAVTDDPPPQAVQQTGGALIGQAPAPEQPVPTRSEPMNSGGGLVVLPEPAQPQNPTLPQQAEEEPAARTVAATSTTDTSQLQSWYELPSEFRNRLDLPRLDLHVYSEEPQDRFILVDFKKYRESERLESGIVLEEILPGGMVMSYRGERFLVEK